ncbi:MAG TPA: ubiquinol-cytochrome C chaperone family protein [Candidatus Peribacteraceae bacterium]|nr:ubiquinol-cytochrome C chaperone family protein [Candidatus Peribacteraceae bacterium]
MLNLLGRSAGRKQTVRQLYAATVERARAPVFFTKLGVPDTIDGRFDLLTLHAWVVLDRLREANLPDLSQAFMDTVFIGFDEGLRDLGAGDMGMGRRMKKLADAFYGRLSSYDGSKDLRTMGESLLRNLYRGAGDTQNAEIVARYVETARAHVAQSDIASGALNFGPVP